MCMVRSPRTLLYPEDGGSELFRNVDNCESTQYNIIIVTVRTSNLASGRLYHCTNIACSAATDV